MELKLKEGWLNYLLSGFFFGLFLAALGLLYAAPESVTFSNILYTIIAVVASVFAFLMGCRVKRH